MAVTVDRGYAGLVRSVSGRPRRFWLPLTIGFGTLVLLTALATLLTFTKSFSIFRQLSQAHERHYRVGDALMRLRSDLYLAGILKRDFLLDRNEAQAQAYGEQFGAIGKSAENSLAILQQELGRQQADAVARLRTEVRAYMRPLQQALNWEPVEAAGLRWYLLRMQLRQRTTALQLAAEIEKINSNALREQQRRISQAEADFRKTLLFISAACIVLGVFIAGFTLVYTSRLESASEKMESELRRLSHQVVRVQEHERRTISRELHDEVGQMLTGLRMELANLNGPALQNDAENSKRLQEAKQLTERTLQSVRDLAMLLRPSMLDDLGLSPAIHWQVKEFSRRSGLPVEVSIRGEVDALPDDVRTCVYRVIQEALTNVARHARAKKIRLAVTRDDHSVTATVEDDGIGFDTTNIPLPGVGLLGIHERVAELAGNVQISSSAGKGTRVFVQIPVLAGATC
jgi:signal transduction histidine kinase